MAIFDDAPRITHKIKSTNQQCNPIDKGSEISQHDERINEIKNAKVGKESGHILLNANSTIDSERLPYKLHVPLPNTMFRGKADAIFVVENGDLNNYERQVVALIEFKTEITVFDNIYQGLFELIGI